MQPVLWWRPTVTRSPSRMLQPSSSLQGPASDSRAVMRPCSSGLYTPEVAAMTASWALSPLQAWGMVQPKHRTHINLSSPCTHLVLGRP
jgi:hypothetical protein